MSLQKSSSLRSLQESAHLLFRQGLQMVPNLMTVQLYNCAKTHSPSVEAALGLLNLNLSPGSQHSALPLSCCAASTATAPSQLCGHEGPSLKPLVHCATNRFWRLCSVCAHHIMPARHYLLCVHEAFNILVEHRLRVGGLCPSAVKCKHSEQI